MGTGRAAIAAFGLTAALAIDVPPRITTAAPPPAASAQVIVEQGSGDVVLVDADDARTTILGGLNNPRGVALAPDGGAIAVAVAGEAPGEAQLVVIRADRTSAVLVDGGSFIEDVAFVDDETIAFTSTADGTVSTVDVAGGPPVVLAELPAQPTGIAMFEFAGQRGLATVTWMGPVVAIDPSSGLIGPFTADLSGGGHPAATDVLYLPEFEADRVSVWPPGSDPQDGFPIDGPVAAAVVDDQLWVTAVPGLAIFDLSSGELLELRADFDNPAGIVALGDATTRWAPPTGTAPDPEPEAQPEVVATTPPETGDEPTAQPEIVTATPTTIPAAAEVAAPPPDTSADAPAAAPPADAPVADDAAAASDTSTDDGGFPWWILLILGMLAAAALIALWWRRANRDAEVPSSEAAAAAGRTRDDLATLADGCRHDLFWNVFWSAEDHLVNFQREIAGTSNEARREELQRQHDQLLEDIEAARQKFLAKCPLAEPPSPRPVETEHVSPVPVPCQRLSIAEIARDRAAVLAPEAERYLLEREAQIEEELRAAEAELNEAEEGFRELAQPGDDPAEYDRALAEQAEAGRRAAAAAERIRELRDERDASQRAREDLVRELDDLEGSIRRLRRQCNEEQERIAAEEAARVAAADHSKPRRYYLHIFADEGAPSHVAVGLRGPGYDKVFSIGGSANRDCQQWPDDWWFDPDLFTNEWYRDIYAERGWGYRELVVEITEEQFNEARGRLIAWARSGPTYSLQGTDNMCPQVWFVVRSVFTDSLYRFYVLFNGRWVFTTWVVAVPTDTATSWFGGWSVLDDAAWVFGLDEWFPYRNVAVGVDQSISTETGVRWRPELAIGTPKFWRGVLP